MTKGLAYIHERLQAENCLLIFMVNNFDAKVSDFGLSKLLDWDKTNIRLMTMRGTPRFLAHEMLISVITKKVYVYSYRVVVLEIRQRTTYPF